MKKIILSWIVVLMSNQHLRSQSVFTTQEFKRGGYKDFKEFITNSPSLIPGDDVWIDEREKDLLDNYTPYVFVYTGREVTLTMGRLKTREGNKRIDTKDFWGYCDGLKFYINSYTHIPRHYFVPLLLVGRYCYFIQVDPNSNSPNAQPQHTNGVAEYIINVNNGKIFELDRKLLKLILQDDKELLNEFNNDKEVKGKLLMDYIKRYNERHHDEIKILTSDEEVR